MEHRRRSFCFYFLESFNQSTAVADIAIVETFFLFVRSHMFACSFGKKSFLWCWSYEELRNGRNELMTKENFGANCDVENGFSRWTSRDSSVLSETWSAAEKKKQTDGRVLEICFFFLFFSKNPFRQKFHFMADNRFWYSKSWPAVDYLTTHISVVSPATFSSSFFYFACHSNLFFFVLTAKLFCVMSINLCPRRQLIR